MGESQTEALANHWRDAIAPVLPGFDVAESKPKLAEWAAELSSLLQAPSLEEDKAQAIGKALALDVSPEPAVLGQTQKALGEHLLAGVPAEEAAALQPRVIPLLAALAAGFGRGIEESAATLRSKFLSSTVHELRSPLNAIIGFSRIILKRIDGPITELQEQDLNAVYNGGQSLLSHLGDMFKPERIEVDQPDVGLGKFSVQEVIDPTMAVVQPLAEENSDTLTVEVVGDTSKLHSDPEKMEQILTNLLSYAVKYTRLGSVKLVISERDVDGDRWIRFQITDTGLGMTPDQITRFEQAKSASAVQFGEIELMISHRYCRMLGGSVAVESEIGKGTTFTVDLPVTHPDAT